MSQQTLVIQPKKLSPEIIIRTICIIYGAVFIYQTYSTIDSLLNIIPNLFSYSFKVVFLLVFLFVVPLSLVLLWVKEKGGWIMLMFMICYYLPGSLYYNIKLYLRAYGNVSENISVPRPNILEVVLTTALLVGIIVALTRKDILAMYKISNKNILTVVILGLVVFTYMYFL